MLTRFIREEVIEHIAQTHRQRRFSTICLRTHGVRQSSGFDFQVAELANGPIPPQREWLVLVIGMPKIDLSKVKERQRSLASSRSHLSRPNCKPNQTLSKPVRVEFLVHALVVPVQDSADD